MSSRARVAVAGGVAVVLAVILTVVITGLAGTAIPFAGMRTNSVEVVPVVEQYSADSAAVGGSVAQESPAAPESSKDQGASIAMGEPLVVRTASIEVRVDDVDAALVALRRALAAAGAEITNLSVSSGELGVMPLTGGEGGQGAVAGPTSAVVTIRVPADALPALEKDAAALGALISQSSSADDVTEQAIDLEARLKNLRAEEVRLRSFLDRTSKVSELLEVERELARVRGEIESMDAQLTYLKRQAARATLTVTLYEPGPVVAGGNATWGLREAFARGVQVAGALVQALVTAAVPLALLAALAFAIIWPVRALARRRSARRAATPPTEDQ